MIEINILEIKQTLQKLLRNEITREDASRWAFNLRQEADNNNLNYKPKEFEDLIWESILFIEGIDMKNDPNVYLYNFEDLFLFLQKIEGVN